MAQSDWPSVPAPDGVDTDAWNAAVAAARARCGWHIAPVITERVVLDGNGATVLMLPSLAVQDARSVVEDDREVTDARASRYGMLIKARGGRWAEGFSNIRVELTHGYDEFPPELLAVLREAAEYGVAGSLTTQVGQVKFGGSGVMPGSASFMSGQDAALNTYRLGSLP